MSVRTASRAPGGAVAIAGVDASYCRRLLQSLRADNGSRPISTLAAGDDLPKQIAASVPSVILFDLGPSPDAKGLAIVSALSRLAKTIVLAGTDDDALAVQALKAGASSRAAPRRPSLRVSTVPTRRASGFGQRGPSARLELAVAIGRATALRTKVG